MAALSGTDFGVRLCEILQLDPKKTKNIIISSVVEEPVMVYVTQYLQDVEITPLFELLEKGKIEKYVLNGENNNTLPSEEL